MTFSTPLRFCLLLVLSLLFSIVAAGQPGGEPISIGKQYTFASDVLEQDRPVMVYLPEDYWQRTQDVYPVLYLLDGKGNFHHTTAAVKFLAKNRRIPRMIVVGIPNTDDRTRDLTPVTETGKDNFPTAGGADRMHRFLTTELRSWVNETFRTADFNVLVGHSFGGLFATHALINHPGGFEAYLAISPSLWWDEQRLVLEQAEAFFREHQDLRAHFFMTMGNEGRDMVGGMWKLAALLEEQAPENLRWDFVRLPEESHGSIPMRSTYRGLEFIFANWRMDENLREAVRLSGSAALMNREQTVEKQYGLPVAWGQEELLRMGRQFYEEGNYSGAKDLLMVTTKRYPKMEQAWTALGETQLRLGEEAGARESFLRAYGINPERQSTKLALAKLGETIDGMEAYVADVKQFPHYVGKYETTVGMMVEIGAEGDEL
ncbi:alpha/beta hydrolase-fold protein [Lewinella sp. W8]|uniref:alpha/beta hydrolase-fold protein n=1 Tax=Lewinella sp. W8 TaxID=2528208 RepID=UPI001067DF78|nr:alpha/beta hydrolase-fold protein [Lewinella sp. W8]MTB52836.1 hypothetical protein [Lewinella sp. W8]